MAQKISRPSLKGGNFPSYKYFRAAIPTIYGVRRGLDLSPPIGRRELELNVKAACRGVDEGINVEAALCLYDLIRPNGYTAYDHPPRDLRLGLNRTAAIGLSCELVKDDELIFQFPFPRRTRLDDHHITVLLSLLHHAYAVGDREEAAVELADLSCTDQPAAAKRERLPSVRSPRIVRLAKVDLVSREDLGPEIQSVHDILLELGEEPEAA